MSHPDQNKPQGVTIAECLWMTVPWAATLFVILAGSKEIAPLFCLASGTLDIVLLAVFKEMRS